MPIEERAFTRLLRRVDLLERLASRKGHGHILGYAQVTASQQNITTETDLTGLSVTVDVAANRRIRITGSAINRQITSAGLHTGYIKESTTYLGRWAMSSQAAGEYSREEGSVVVTPSAGSHTYKLSLETTAGSVSMTAAAELPAFILVEDLGKA